MITAQKRGLASRSYPPDAARLPELLSFLHNPHKVWPSPVDRLKNKSVGAQRPAQPSVKLSVCRLRTKQENASGRPTPGGSLLASKRTPGAAPHVGTKPLTTTKWPSSAGSTTSSTTVNLADVERYTHLLVGSSFYCPRGGYNRFNLLARTALAAGGLGAATTRTSSTSRAGRANWRPLPPKQKGSKRRSTSVPLLDAVTVFWGSRRRRRSAPRAAATAGPCRRIA